MTNLTCFVTQPDENILLASVATVCILLGEHPHDREREIQKGLMVGSFLFGVLKTRSFYILSFIFDRI